MRYRSSIVDKTHRRDYHKYDVARIVQRNCLEHRRSVVRDAEERVRFSLPRRRQAFAFESLRTLARSRSALTSSTFATSNVSDDATSNDKGRVSRATKYTLKFYRYKCESRSVGGFALANWRAADTVPRNERERTRSDETGARFRLWNARD